MSLLRTPRQPPIVHRGIAEGRDVSPKRTRETPIPTTTTTQAESTTSSTVTTLPASIDASVTWNGTECAYSGPATVANTATVNVTFANASDDDPVALEIAALEPGFMWSLPDHRTRSAPER